MEKDIEDIRAGGSKDGMGREEHGIVKRIRAHTRKKKLRGKEIKVIRSHLQFKPVGRAKLITSRLSFFLN